MIRAETLEARTLLAGTGGFFDAHLAIGTEAGSDVALGDFNEDGKLDPVVVGPGAAARYYFLSNSGGAVSNVDRRQLDAATSGFRVEAGDLDNNGEDDVVVLHAIQQGLSVSGRLDVHLNATGASLFNSVTSFSLPMQNPLDVAIGDLNGDGLKDIWVTTTTNSLLFINDGTTFAQQASLTQGVNSRVRLGDLDGDGDLDAFAVPAITGGQVLLNQGKLSFTAADVSGIQGAKSVAFADLDADGDLDAAVGIDRVDAGVRQPNVVLLNAGSGSFAALSSESIPATSGENPSVATGDFNGDGLTDILFGYTNGGRQVLQRNNAATFSYFELAQAPASSGENITSVAIADFDGDSNPDLYTTSFMPFTSTANDNFDSFFSNYPTRPNATSQTDRVWVNPTRVVNTGVDVGVTILTETPETIAPGDGTLTHAFRVLSNGPMIPEIVVLQLTLSVPTGVTLTSVVSSMEGTFNSVTRQWSIPIIGSIDLPTLTITYDVTAAADDGTVVESELELVSVTPADSVSTNNLQKIVTPVGAEVFTTDFGDANGTQTLLADDGARHTIHPTIRLGEFIDGEADGNNASSFLGDDTVGASDDEDGIAFVLPIYPLLPPGTSGTFSVDVTAQTGGEEVFLQGWIDFNRDGDFSESDEQIITNRRAVDGLNRLGFNIPAGTVSSAGSYPVRFRVSTQQDLGPTGLAPDGEVEDRTLTFGPNVPLLIDLRKFSGRATIETFRLNGLDYVRVLDGTRVLLAVPAESTNSVQLIGEDGKDDNVLVRFGVGEKFAAQGISFTGNEGDNDRLVINGGNQFFTFSNEEDDFVGGAIQNDFVPTQRVVFNQLADNAVTLDNINRLTLNLSGDLGPTRFEDGTEERFFTLAGPEIPDLNLEKQAFEIIVNVDDVGTTLLFLEAIADFDTRRFDVNLPAGRLALHPAFLDSLRDETVEFTVFNSDISQVDVGAKPVYFNAVDVTSDEPTMLDVVDALGDPFAGIDVSGDEPIWLKIDVSGDEPIWAERLLIDGEVFRANRFGSSKVFVKTGADLPISLPLSGDYRIISRQSSRQIVLGDGTIVLQEPIVASQRPALHLKGTTGDDTLIVDFTASSELRAGFSFDGLGGANEFLITNDANPIVTGVTYNRQRDSVSLVLNQSSLASIIGLQNVQFVSDTLNPNVRTINFTSSSEEVVVSGLAPEEVGLDLDGRGAVLVEVTAGARRVEFAFDDPKQDLVLNLGAGNDHLVLSELPLSFGESIVVNGGSGNDSIEGNAAANPLNVNGGDGADSIDGSDLDDSLNGQSGNDTIWSGSGSDVVNGEDGLDFLFGESGSDSINGGAQADVIAGGLGDDFLIGEDGADTIDGEANNDLLFGGLDDDSIVGGTGSDLLVGDDGDDRLLGGMQDDELHGGEGDDVLLGGGGADTLSGGVGEDILNGQGSSNDVLAEAINSDLRILADTLIAGPLSFRGPTEIEELGSSPEVDRYRGFEAVRILVGDSLLNPGTSRAPQVIDARESRMRVTLTGNEGNDILIGSRFSDVINGGGGDDLVYAGSGSDVVDGGEGDDELRGELGNDTLVGGTGRFLDELFGDDGDDVLEGGPGGFVESQFFTYADRLNGGPGRDTVRERGTFLQVAMPAVLEFDQSPRINKSDDVSLCVDIETAELIADATRGSRLTASVIANNQIFAPFAAVTLTGGAGDDTLTGTNRLDTLLGNGGNDVLDGNGGGGVVTVVPGTPVTVTDVINGGDGNDTLFGGEGPDLLEGGAGNDVLIGDRLGSLITPSQTGKDTLNGGDGDDTLEGGNETDLLLGGNGNDSLLGGNDSDTLQGGIGNDILKGEAGPDSLIGEDGLDTLFGGDARDTLRGGADNDLLTGDDLFGVGDADLIYGDAGNDSLVGLTGNDSLLGGLGNDTIFGGAGNDLISGDDGNDSLNGDAGADIMHGGAGADILNGGSENDTMLGGLNDDTLNGADGSDVMLGEAGNDILNPQGQTDRVTGGGNGVAVSTGDRLNALPTEIDNALTFDFGRLLFGL